VDSRGLRSRLCCTGVDVAHCRGLRRGGGGDAGGVGRGGLFLALGTGEGEPKSLRSGIGDSAWSKSAGKWPSPTCSIGRANVRLAREHWELAKIGACRRGI
jgi:hypothetical protein